VDVLGEEGENFDESEYHGKVMYGKLIVDLCSWISGSLGGISCGITLVNVGLGRAWKHSRKKIA